MENTIEWDESRKNDPAFLAEYYQSVADKWKGKNEKIYKRFQQGADKAKREALTLKD